MERFITKNLRNWKNNPNHKPLILEGARQVGKTWILKEFASKEYENFAYINCDENKDSEKIFTDFDCQRIIRTISAVTNTDIKKKKSLIFIDEIQENNKALSSLKYFCENEPEYDIVCAGSLLGLKIHHGTGFPVGKVDMMTLYPLSFNEFLLALGKNQILNMVQSHYWEETNLISNTLTELLRQYYFVGGMPEAVSEYASSGNIFNVRKIQMQILNDYSHDFSKHIPNNILPKVNMVWNSVSSQLAKENKKFIYSAIRKGSRAREFENAIQWLYDAGLVHTVKRITKMEKPLKHYEDFNSFKLFLNDLGLLGALNRTEAKDILIDNKAFSMYKESFTEQFVLQQYLSATEGKELFYYTNENSTAEIDFVFQKESIYAVEVKAETNLKAKSLSTALKNSEMLKGLRFSMSGYKEQERIINIPLYLAEEYIKMLYSLL